MRTACWKTPRIKEEITIRTAYSLLLTLILLLGVGCGGSAKKKTDHKKQEPPEERIVNTESGEVSKRNDKGDRLLLWTVKWESARLIYANKAEFSGKMKKVSGTIFQLGKPASTFSADEAQADRQSNTLILSGHIVVLSKAPKARLTCDRLVWDADKEIVKASGSVTMDALDYKMVNINELWASPTLDQVGTPDTFNLSQGSPKK